VFPRYTNERMTAGRGERIDFFTTFHHRGRRDKEEDKSKSKSKSFTTKDTKDHEGEPSLLRRIFITEDTEDTEDTRKRRMA
jgi:hypothetical protein